MSHRTTTGPIGTLWHVVSDGAGHRVLPDGVMDIVWSSGRLVFAGPDTQAAMVRAPMGTATWGVRLSPGVAHALLGVPADELVNQRIMLADLVPLSGATIGAAFRNPATALPSITKELWRRALPNASDLALATSLSRDARTGRNVREIAEHHGLTERTLHRQSRRLFGYGIKSLQSIYRFHNALRLVRSGTPRGEAAALAGFADQPHLARETQRLAGVILSTLLS